MAEHDLAEAAALMGAGLHLLQRDLILESVRVELEQKDIARAGLISLFLYSGDVPPGKNFVEPRRLELLPTC